MMGEASALKALGWAEAAGLTALHYEEMVDAVRFLTPDLKDSACREPPGAAVLSRWNPCRRALADASLGAYLELHTSQPHGANRSVPKCNIML